VKVLLVAHYFPPDGGPGAQRPASFARHLPALGCEVTVVTRAQDHARNAVYDPHDASLLAWIEGAPGVRVERAAVPAGGQPADWTAALSAKAVDVAEAWRPDVVLATLSPFDLADAAFAVRASTGARAVIDLRDPWALDGWFVSRHWLEHRRALERMNVALASADGVIANVPGARAAFERAVPRMGRVPYAVVTNGWEESDFPAPTDVPKGDVWRLRVAGNFLSTDFQRFPPAKRAWRLLRVAGERIDGRGRSPYFLLGALQSLRADAHPAGRDTVVEIAGNVDPLTQRVIEDSGFADRVRTPGFMPHDRCTEFAATADALVLAMHGLPAGARARMVPGKFYEYLATGRPILGLAPEGDARDWLREDPRSRVADPCSAASIREALVTMHEAWRRGDAVASYRIPLAARFTRRAQAEVLAAYLREVCASRSNVSA
jgi:glycosyltransferase involved in cell wall biosynthesis